MKNITFLLLLIITGILTHTISAKAQNGFYVSAQVVPQLGVMFNADEVKTPQSDYKFKGSRNIGIGAGYTFRNNMGMGVELVYTDLKQGYINGDLKYTQQFSYLTIPLLFTYNSNPGKLVSFECKAGPQLGMLMASSIKDANDITLNGSTKDRYQPVTAGAVIGAGGSLRLTNAVCFNLGLRFSSTFTNTEKWNYLNNLHGRAKAYYLNGGVELGLKYFIR